MSLPRFYFSAPLSPADIGRDVNADEAASRHIAHALRMRVGDRITLFTGRGGEFAATITHIDKRAVTVRIDAFEPIERELSHPVALVQALIAVDMMDVVIRKATELGATTIVPLIAERSQRSPDTRSTKRIQRWRQIAVAACEQCGRNRIPIVCEIELLTTWLDRHAAETAAVMLTPDASVSLLAALHARSPRAILIGPEGGFTEREIDHARAHGVALARFGARVLRAETAAVAALAVVNAIDDRAIAT